MPVFFFFSQIIQRESFSMLTGWQWEKLCGRGHGNFTVWDNGDFSHCFEQLIFVCLSHAVLGIVSAYHFSRHHSRRLRGHIPHSPTLYLRLAVSLALVLAPLLMLALVYLYEEFHPSLIDILSWIVRAASWFIHSGFVWRLRRYYHLHIRGPSVMLVSFFLTTASLIIQLRSVILDMRSGKSTFTLVEEWISFITAALHLIYSLSLVPWKRPEIHSSLISDYQAINETLENERLADTSGTSYGSILHPPESDTRRVADIQLGVGEDGTGCLSRLTFWWVQSLMLKGSKQTLTMAKDLFQLPGKLSTEMLEERFLSSLRYFDDSSSSSADDPGQCDASLPEVGFSGSEEFVDRQSDTVPESPSISRQHRRSNPVSLLRALNKAFGREYYSLGILKFFGDGLGFAGPMLLNLLVSYMENQKEATWHGYAYAAGLFCSTLLSAMFTTHFYYHVGVVGLKIRAALITTVYRKALSVSSVSLSKFSSGEIVNFMSTDTDRIINFCPSFHAFWSLPVQTAIALYLLYREVGWAFLTGLAFTLLLIPINRWLAIKIGSLSKDMMSQKDGRVKVAILAVITSLISERNALVTVY